MEKQQSVAVQPQQQMTAKSLFSRDDVKKKFEELLGRRSTGFITSVLQIVSSNGLLADADPNSIYQAAALAATLDLPLNNSLGFAYIIPYNTRQKDGSYRKAAQFQIGYKGIIQLALRSGQFKTISSTPVYEGQIVEMNQLTGFTFDWAAKKSDVVVGYASYFSLINGFEKTLFMSIDELKKHGKKYSKTFSNSNGLWNTDFDAMASKTVLKLLLSKFAPLSIEMQKAVIHDQAVIKDVDTDDVMYVDVEDVSVDKELERIRLMIDDCANIFDLEALENNVPEDLLDYYIAKKDSLK